VPMGLGVVDLAPWLVSGRSAFEVIGLVIFLGGLAAVLIGLLLLVMYQVTLPAGHGRRPWRRSSWPVVLLLLANFPVAADVIYVATYFQHPATLTVANRSTAGLTKVRIITPGGRSLSLGDVAPGASRSRTIYLRRGTFGFFARRGAVPVSGTVATFGDGDAIDFTAGLTLTVSDTGSDVTFR